MNKFNNAILEYYPQALKALYIIDLPWMLNSIMRFLMTFVDPRLRQTVHFIKASELFNHIDASYIPMGLSGHRNKRIFPSDLIPLDRCYKQVNLDEKFVEYFYNLYKLERTKN